MEQNAFKFKKNGTTPQLTKDDSSAGRAALSRTVKCLNIAINSPSLNDKQRVVALRSVSTHHKSRCFFQSAGLSDVKKEKMLDYVQEQLQNMIAVARRTNDRQGKANDDRRSFVEALVMAIADPGLLDNDNNEGTEHANKTPSPSTIEKINFLGLPTMTGYRLFKKQAKKKKAIMEGTHVDGWVGVTSRDGFMQKVPNKVRERVVKWIKKHHHVIHSPIAKDTI